MTLSESIERWRHRGAVLRIHDMDIFYVLEGKGSPVVVLHGFPTSSYDWSATLPELAAKHQVLLMDLPGFGLSSKPKRYSYSLLDQAEVVSAVCEQLGVTHAHLVAHDAGASVVCELLARREEGTLPLSVRSVSFVNAGVYPDMVRLTPMQRLLRRPVLGPLFTHLASPTLFNLQFRRLVGRPDAVPSGEIDQLWYLISRGGGLRRLPLSARYISERVERADRWLPPLARLDVPALVLWGRRDPVAAVAIAKRLAYEIPTSKLIVLDDLGHYPHMEDPARVADVLCAFFDGVDVPRRVVRPEAVSP